MRKILYLLPVAAFFVSCVADSIQEELSTSQGQHGVCLFDASISEREGTRVVGEWGTDGILAEWESSDRIGVFAGDETQAAVFTVKELDGTNAVFEGETIADAASYLAFYPYSELLGREGTSLSGKMNFLQRYSSPGYGENRIGIQPDFFPMLAYSPTGAHSLSFRQMCAYIRVRVRASATLAGDTYLKSVILQGNDGEVLAGEGIRVVVAAADDASLNIRTGDPVLSVDASEQTYSAVALDLTDPDQPEGETNGSLLSQSEFTEFYIALPPQNFAKGCKLTFIDTRNRYMGTLTSKPFNAARGQFVTFRAGGAEKVFEYIADNALIWQDTPRLLLHANRQAESPSGYDLTGGSDANLANCYVITPSMLAAHPDGLFCFPAKSPVQSGTVYWDDLLLDTNDYMVFTVDKTMARTGGNAVIGYLDPATGLVKWSWHIWVVTDELFAKDQDYERQEGEQTLIYRMMDRNLGANDPTGSGDRSRSCLYQWGRKDPFSNATTVYGPEGNTLDMHSWPSCEGYTIDPVWNAQIGRKSGDYLYNGTVEFTLSHPATYISYADEKDISNPNQTWLRSDVPGHRNDRLWGTYFEKEAVGAATVLLSKSAFDPCPAGYRIPLIAPLKFTGNDVESYTTEGVWLYIDSQRSVKAWYPYAGSRFSKMDASGKQIGILGYTEGALGLYQFSYAASIWSATLEFVQEISVGTSCNSDDLTVTGYSSTGYRPEFVYEGPYARSFALAVRCVREDANGIVR